MKTWEDVRTAVMRYAEFLSQEVLVKAEHQLWHVAWAGRQGQARPSSVLAALDACPWKNISMLLEILAELPSPKK